jgi:ATP-binding cassette subfamily B protein
MLLGALTDDRRFLAPQVVQSSAMDCGPAALKCLLEGFGISVSYGRLREACQTDVDGTSIDTLEDIAGQLGLDAVQMMMPADHLLLPETQSLPALTVIRLPTGDNHFVVVWGLHGRWVQVMDPATGRRWLSRRRFLDELSIHHQYIDAADWRDWAASPGFCEPLRQRLERLEFADAAIHRLLDGALAVPGWHALATLDAGTRMVEALVRAGGLMPGEEAESVLVHELHALRQLPYLGVGLLQTGFQLVLTAAGIIWLSPASTLIVIVSLLVTLGLAFAGQPMLIERDMNLRTHDAALSRFYLDALLGLIPIRTHTAERVVRLEHEGMPVKWIDASLAFYRAETLLHAMAALVGTAFAVWIPFNFIAQGGEASGVLLLVYWALRLPALGHALAASLQQYPMQRNRFLRLLELLNAPEEARDVDLNSPLNTVSGESAADGGVAIEMRGLNVRAGGHTILQDINLAVARGEHIAVVGPSGAGKSSLLGILLGWHLPAQGDVLVNGAPLEGQRLSALRSETAWVDSAVQIWNRSLFDNLHYGVRSAGRKPLSTAIQGANLFDVLERLPDGLQTLLGELKEHSRTDGLPV